MNLEIKDLHVSVDGKEILKGVNLIINLGEVHALMGPNGSGKSTLANAIMGHPKYKIEKGQIILTWGAYGVIVNELVKKIKSGKERYDGIFGIPRGGLSVAVALSHQLNLPLLLYPTEKSLVVDDISDTGKTLQSYKNKSIATLYTTKWTKTKPNYYVGEKFSKKEWIVFPWEKRV